MVLAAGVFLREQPIFWRNAGGYPIWLRDLVQIFFFPWLGLCIGSLTLWSGWIFGTAAQRGRGLASAVGAATSLWAALGCICLYMAWNKLENVAEGKALHHHEVIALHR